MGQDKPETLVEVLEERECYRFDHLFRVVETRLRHRRRDGSMSPPMVRVDFERGPAVAVLVVNPETDTVVLVRQFRYSAYALGQRSGEGGTGGWLLEIPAGILEEGEEPEVVARREVLEETGYRLRGSLEPLGAILPSAGASSEVTHIFLATVAESDRVAEGGGLPHEHEDIEVVHVGITEALDLVPAGKVKDAKTVIALQHLALRRLAARG